MEPQQHDSVLLEEWGLACDLYGFKCKGERTLLEPFSAFQLAGFVIASEPVVCPFICLH